MANASDTQVQNFVDARIRPRAEQIRNLYLAIKDDLAHIDEIYAALTQQNPTWADTRQDTVNLSPSDVLAVNTALHAIVAMVEGGQATDMQAFAGQYAIVQKACVRQPNQ